MEKQNQWNFLFVFVLALYISGNLVNAEIALNFTCPDGWENVGVSCFLFVDKKRLWTTAQKTCESYGANLVKISDFQSNLDVGEFAKSKGEEEIWTGLNRRKTEKSDKYGAKWADGSDGSVYEGWWLNNEPDIDSGECVLQKRSEDDYKWWFASCEQKASFICELPVCAEGMFHCKNGDCRNENLKCDGIKDCAYGSDEMNCPTDCKYFVTLDESGTAEIKSPGYPSDYSPNLDCQWAIESPVGTNVYLNFSHLETERDADNIYVFLDMEEMETFSGNMQSSLPKVVAASNFLVVRFSSDNSSHSKGFMAQVKTLKADLKDREMLTATSIEQYLTSPFRHYDLYLNNQNFVWIIQAEHRTQIITLEKIEVDLMDDAEIIIRDGDMVSHPLLSKITSKDPGSNVIQSTGNKMYILFSSYGQKYGKGFKFSYREGCSISLKEETGMVYSSGYPTSKYANFQTCTWKIETSTPKNIRLLFKDNFKLADDDLLVYKSMDESSDSLILNVTNTDVTPEPLDSPMGKFSIKFVSNAIKNEQGFFASYSIDCPDPNFNENHTVIAKDPMASGYPYGVVVNISCQNGNYFAYEDLKDVSPREFDSISSKSMECLSGGKWSISRIPHCSLRFCGAAPVVTNGFVIESTGVTYGSQVTYKCNNGFKLTPKDTIDCQADGTWEPKPKCDASTCSSPTDISHGKANVTVGDGTTFGSIVKYDCETGYEIDGAPIKLCQSSGNWSEATPICKKLKCPLPNIQNGHYDNDVLPEFEDSRKVLCNSGYKINGSSTLKCGADQTFDSIPTCDDINECDDDIDGCAGNCINTDGSFYCTCNSGFYLGVDSKSCPDVLDCLHVNAYCSQKCSEDNVTGGYYCECNETGYTLFTRNGIEEHWLPNTQDGLSYSDLYYINHTCVRKNCPDLPDISNGVKSTMQDKFFFEDKAKYTCNIGYVIEGGVNFQKTKELSCLETGLWSGSVPNCTVAQCAADYTFNPTPLSPITPVLSNNGSLDYNEVLTITCDLKIPGINVFTKQRKCVYDKTTQEYKLEGDSYDCGYVNCGEPPLLGNNKTWGSSLKFNYGDTFEFRCADLFDEKGGSSQGNKTVRCESDGQWGFGDLQCVGLTCSDPGTPPDATQVGETYEVGSMIKYTCNRTGFALQPEVSLFCVINETGNGLKWNGSKPVCVDTQAPAIERCVDRVEVKKYEVIKDVLKSLNLKMTDNSLEGQVLDVIDDQIGVLKVRFEPINADRDLQITEDQTVNITVEDSKGNQAPKCVIHLVVLDEIPPVVECPASKTVSLDEMTSTETLSFDVDTLDAKDNIKIQQKLFTPHNITVDHDNINSEPITVTGTVFDTSNNKASCTFEISVKASSCSLMSKPVIPFSNDSCSGDPSSGYTCVYTCNTGYTLYENPGTSITARCSKGSEWDITKYYACVKVPEDAVGDGNDELAEYKYRFTAVYNSTGGQNVSSSCILSYKTTVENQYTLTNRFPKTCDIPNLRKDVEVNVLVEMNLVIVKYMFTIGPQGFDRNLQELCYEDIKDTVAYPKFNELLNMSPTGCPSVDKPKSEIKEESVGYECKTERKLAFETKCLPCPVGTEWNGAECSACDIGYFIGTEGSEKCTQCASNTLTYQKGTTDNGKCTATCIPGRISPTQLPPCTSCPLGTYSVNQTHCEDCPTGYITNSIGSTSVSNCRAPCQPGYYSGTGYEPCNECPKNFYSSSSASTSCMECSDKKYTISKASNNSNDCINTVDLCNATCKNNGTCTLLNHGYVCVCETGFTGPTCQWDIDSCKSSPCHNGGTCTDTPSGYSCSCVQGTSGDNCEVNADDCKSDTCTENGMCKDLIDGTECLCKGTTYSGVRCEIQGSPCAGISCSGHGTCNSVGSVRYKCACSADYTGTECENIIDECKMNTCYYNGSCNPVLGDFNCDCQDGYDGKRCGNRKSFCDVNTCGTNGVCFDDYDTNDYYCVCKPGYESGSTRKVCTEINECSSKPCVNGTCKDLVGKYQCDCTNGFIGQKCQFDIDDCAGNPCGEGKGNCTDGISSYSCNCNAGYESRDTGSGPSCVDVDNCLADTCNNRGKCEDAVDDYICTCDTGYSGKNCSINIDDCYGNPCFHDGNCTDGLNSYTCNCKPGWTGKRCDSIVADCNSTLCKQSAECHNLFNNFFCECNPYTYGDMCENSARVCTNVNPCQNSGKCNENEGDVNCTCPDSYYGSGCQIMRDFCAEDDYCKNDGECTTTESGPVCKCKSGFSGDNCEIKDNNCDTACPSQYCVNVDDKAYCDCPPTKEGAFCSKDLDTAYSLEFSDKSAKAEIPYPVDITGDGLSISLNVQYRTPGASGTYLRFYNVPSNNSLDGKEKSFTMHEKGVTVFTNEEKTIPYPLKVHDGFWHSVVVTWDRNTDVFRIIVDTIKLDDEMPKNASGLKNIMFDLGSSDVDKQDGFIGSISQVNVYARVLDFSKEVTPIFNNPQAVRSGILRGWNGYQLIGNVKRIPYAIDFDACPIGRSGTKCNTVNRESAFEIDCNMMDIHHYSKERVSNVNWNEPTKAGVTIKGTHSPGEPLLWGRYPATYQFEDGHGNKALCHFKVYVQNDQCTAPQEPFDGSVKCSKHDNYRNCEIVCPASSHKVSSEIPKFYTCGPSGSWDPRWSKRFLPSPVKLFPSCGLNQNPVKLKLKIKFTYRLATPNCEDAGRKTVVAIRLTLATLNGMFSGLCSNGNCTDIIIKFTCSLSRTGRAVNTGSTGDSSVAIDITIPSADPTLSNGGENISASDLITRTVLASGLFYYEFAPVQTLDADTFVIEIESSCPFGMTVVEGDCVSCPNGTYYNSTTATCIDCEIGWWSDDGNQTECTQCESGKTTVYEGSTSKDDCKISCKTGEKFDLTEDKCVECPHGFYQPDVGQFFCYPCQAGTTTKDMGSVNSTLCYSTCGAGSELNDAGNCVLCRIGYYRTLNSPSVCSKCDGKLTLTKKEGSTSKDDCNLIACPLGERRLNDSLCVKCDIGYYQNQTNQDFCYECDPNHRTNMEGASNATECKFYCTDGEYQKNTSSKDCEPCPFGLYRNNTENDYDSSKCEGCNNNRRTNRTGSTSKDECTVYKCDAGYKSNLANDGCEPCPTGTYQHEDYQTFCYDCKIGESTRNNASKNSSDCERYCEPGKEMIEGVCKPCKEGFFRNMSDGLFEMCKSCPSEKTTPGTGAETGAKCSIYKCSPGYYRNADETGCIDCDLGSYAEEVNAPNCTLCESGKSTRNKASNSSSQCEAYCESGFEKRGTGCVGCERGYYKDNNDGLYSMCVMCNISYITATENSTSSAACDVENCTLGQKIDGKECRDCGVGYYQDKLWQTNCTKCKGDKSTSGLKSTNESDCRLNCTVGQEDYGESLCRNCSVGFYKNVSGLEKCQKCPSGKTTNIEGADDEADCYIVVCGPGHFRNTSNICEECDYGKYEDTTGKVGSCKNCSSGLTTFKRGSQSDADCRLDCDAGSEYVAARNDCVICGRGYYRDKRIEDQFNCVACDIEFITAGNGSTSNDSCSIRNCTTPGQYYNNITKECTDCDVGYYQNQKWQTECVSCGDGKTTTTTKSVNIDACILDCEAGEQYDDASKLCKPCIKGEFRNVSRGLKCEKCPDDLSTKEEGAKSQNECTVSTCVEGKYFKKDTAACEDCPLDTYQDEKYQSACKKCPNGWYTENRGQKNVTGCKSYCKNENKNNCSTNATCADDADKHFTCKCLDDYQGNGLNCVHLCNAGHCKNDGICIVGPPVSCTCGKYHKGGQCQTDVAAQDASNKLTETITIAVIAGVCGLLALLGLILCMVRCCIKRKRNKDPIFQDSDYYGQDRTSLATKLSTRGYMRNDYDNYYPENMHHLPGKEEFLNPAYLDDAVYTA